MDPSDPSSPIHPLDALPPSQRALLRIVCWVALADGDFALQERELLEKLVARLLQGQGVALMAEAAVRELAIELNHTLELERLVDALDGVDARKLTVKLALQMISICQGPADTELINPSEKQAYRRLLEALALPDAEVEQAEWAARQELGQGRSLMEVLGAALERFGAWPAAEQLDPGLPMGYWL